MCPSTNALCWEVQDIYDCILLSAVHDHMTSGLLGWTGGGGGGGGLGQHAWHHAYRHEKLQRCNEKFPPSSMQACKDIQGQQRDSTWHHALQPTEVDVCSVV